MNLIRFIDGFMTAISTISIIAVFSFFLVFTSNSASVAFGTEIITLEDKVATANAGAAQEAQEAQEASEAEAEIEAETEAGTESVIQEIAEVTKEAITFDRSQPLFILSKDGWRLPNQRVAEQWIVYDLCQKYNFPVRKMFGMILMESEFNPKCKSYAGCKGLGQLSSYWLRAKDVPRFEELAGREIYDAHDNILTAIEILRYAENLYGLSVNSDDDWYKLLYWYNTGRNPKRISKWKYSGKCIQYGNEIVAAQGNY